MLISAFSLLALFRLAATEDTVTSMYLWGLHTTKTILGSIIDNDATAITYYLTCPAEEPSFSCGFGPGITAIDAGDTYTWWGGRGGYGGQNGDGTIACTPTTMHSAVCAMTTAGIVDDNITIANIWTWHSVTVTAGSTTGSMSRPTPTTTRRPAWTGPSVPTTASEMSNDESSTTESIPTGAATRLSSIGVHGLLGAGAGAGVYLLESLL
ncbi:hypothetical protein BJY04DRAFT_185512 [Aspergillus karnatakaensis]|uniref:uncharacterized protein n=1 Tax=Aspergillus karnatakaensis TaxID=1810916 RepID=UPI003CCD7284